MIKVNFKFNYNLYNNEKIKSLLKSLVLALSNNYIARSYSTKQYSSVIK